MKTLKLKKLDRAALYIGCNDRHMRDGSRSATAAAIKEALKYYNIDGATLENASGLWKGNAEKTIKLIIINNFTSGKNFNILINNLYIYLLKKLDQEQIAIEIDKINSNL